MMKVIILMIILTLLSADLVLLTLKVDINHFPMKMNGIGLYSTEKSIIFLS